MFSLFLTGIWSIGNLTVFVHAFHQPARLWKYYIAPLQRKQIFYCKGVFFMTYNISGRKQNLTLQRCNCTPYLKRDIDIPANCTIISEKTFQNRSMIQSVSFPYGLKQIGSNAFSGCSRLKQLLLPESLCQIGKEAFSDCTTLSFQRACSATPTNYQKLFFPVKAGCLKSRQTPFQNALH